ncbi:uncharacterized protein LOC143190720 [Rhynchophorus ferrugineus]|uniref:Uncharacterized protein n=1 Tax=Rhynchophorus ferrugineus TaxID=354439 RepID=A0A834J3S3_RHYFE|nr:hypothetical protein GWI33_000069 [Rhynchophorus ferrugineus]
MLTLIHLFWKPGASSVKNLEKVTKSPLRHFGQNSCSKKPKPPRCSFPKKDECSDPKKQPDEGRLTGQAELAFCQKDCRIGTPNLPPRACLPWERASEMCPEKATAKILHSQCCEHTCEPYIGQGIIDKMKMSVCEYRRFRKCYLKHGNAEKCMNEVTTLYTQKTYPMMHALCKKYLPGCPKKSPKLVMQRSKSECD